VDTNKLEKLILVGLAAGDMATLNVFGEFVSDRVLWVTLGACSAIYVKYKLAHRLKKPSAPIGRRMAS
jgi:hypothetical protein